MEQRLVVRYRARIEKTFSGQPFVPYVTLQFSDGSKRLEVDFKLKAVCVDSIEPLCPENLAACSCPEVTLKLGATKVYRESDLNFHRGGKKLNCSLKI